MQKLIAHYNAYILFFAIYNGLVNYVYAEEIKARLMKVSLLYHHSPYSAGRFAVCFIIPILI
ncbi:MAG: hypothetical protein HFG67_05465 [Firmicutes bacterium]|nr:hypothetical protein [Bacillota bacterium]